MDVFLGATGPQPGLSLDVPAVARRSTFPWEDGFVLQYTTDGEMTSATEAALYTLWAVKSDGFNKGCAFALMPG